MSWQVSTRSGAITSSPIMSPDYASLLSVVVSPVTFADEPPIYAHLDFTLTAAELVVAEDQVCESCG